jgi:hypothetical protein
MYGVVGSLISESESKNFSTKDSDPLLQPARASWGRSVAFALFVRLPQFQRRLGLAAQTFTADNHPTGCTASSFGPCHATHRAGAITGRGISLRFNLQRVLFQTRVVFLQFIRRV